MSERRGRPSTPRTRPASRSASARPPRANSRPRAGRLQPTRPPRSRTHRGVRRLPLARSGPRVVGMLIVLIVVFTVFVGRLIEIQAFDAQAYAASAAEQTRRSLPLYAVRGAITDRNGQTLAKTEPAVAVTADPTLTVGEAPKIAELLVRHLGGTAADYLPKLTKANARFVYLKRKVPTATYEELVADLRAQKLSGIFRESDPIRKHPAPTIATNVVGFTGGDKGEGLAGIEYSMNNELKGVPGREIYDIAPNGSRIPLGNNVLTPAVNGTNLQLTIDADVQWTLQRRLAQAVDQAKAKTGTAVVMNVKTGEVLAMANYPTFDATAIAAAKTDDRGNRAVTDAYEPGSVQKVLTMAALVDGGFATPDTKVRVPERVASADRYITDSFDHDSINLTARGVVAKSSNIGTVLLARQIPKKKLNDYYRAFGLGKKTGIELPGEAAGRLPGDAMADYTRDQVSFGQGLSMTSIQEAAALSAAINGGTYHRPTIIKQATDSTGKAVELPKQESRQVISAESSAKVRDMTAATMAEGGTGVRLRLNSYPSGGKTGTAQRVDPTCGCYRGFTASWMQFAPLDDPQILVLVIIDQPVEGRYGGALAGPVARDILDYTLPRYGILPSDPTPPARSQTW